MSASSSYNPTPSAASYFFLSTVTLSHISRSLSSLATCSTIGARYRASWIVSYLSWGMGNCSLPARLWSIASLVVLGARHSVGMLFAYGMHGRKTLVETIGQLPKCQFLSKEPFVHHSVRARPLPIPFCTSSTHIHDCFPSGTDPRSRTRIQTHDPADLLFSRLTFCTSSLSSIKISSYLKPI